MLSRALLVLSAVIVASDLAFRIESRQEESGVRLDALHARLVTALERDAPDLARELRRSGPKPIRHGYQILPALIPDPPPSSEPPRATVASYSWPRTERGLEEHTARIDALAAEIDRVESIDLALRRHEWEKFARAWERLPQDQKNLDAHVQYNRFWQGEIAKNRPFYDRQTELLNTVLERQKIRDALAASPVNSQPALAARDELLSRPIHEVTNEVTPPAFLLLERPSPHRYVIEVPVYTDIKDRRFLEQFRHAVESVWTVRDGEEEFRIAITIHRVSTARLYKRAVSPAIGDAIVLADHVARFPPDGAVLTTGATTTHVAAGRCIALGPHDLPPHVLAHEFGHILGFKDVYFRGYRDLGAEGFEVMEVVADIDDIMGAAGTGPVKRRHFERVIEILRQRSLAETKNGRR